MTPKGEHGTPAFRTMSIDYVGRRPTEEQFSVLHDLIVELFETFELKIDGMSDGPTADEGFVVILHPGEFASLCEVCHLPVQGQSSYADHAAAVTVHMATEHNGGPS